MPSTGWYQNQMANLRAIDLSHLRYLVAIIDAGSISKAAAELNIVQSALSNRLAALEQHIGAKLVHRSYTGVAPTEAGTLLYATASRVLRDLDSAANEIALLGKAPTGSVRFACGHSAASILAAPLVEEIISTLPEVTFSLVSGASSDLYQRLARGDVDYALLYKRSEVKGVRGEPLIWEDMFLAMSADDPKLAGKTEASLSDVADCDLALPGENRYFGTGTLHERFRAAGLELRVVAQIDSAKELLDLVLRGKVASILPWAICEEKEREGRIRLIPIKGHNLRRNLELVVPSDHALTPGVEAAMRVTRTVVESLIARGKWKHVGRL